MKSMAIIALILVLFIFGGCTSIQEPEQAVAAETPSLLSFKSEAEFIKAIQQAKAGETEDDFANLKGIDRYAVLSSVPSGYSLYKIVVGSHGLAFLYLSDENMKSEEAALEAEVSLNYYHLNIYRDTTLTSLVSQNGWEQRATKKSYLSSADTSDKYFTNESGLGMIYWEQGGLCMSLQLPQGDEALNSMKTDDKFALAYAKIVKLD